MSHRARPSVWSVASAVLVVGALGACQGGVIEGEGPITLAAVDPALLENARLLMFSFSVTTSCEGLIDLSPSGIGEALAAEDPPRQPADNDGEVSHVFGDVPANVPIAFLVLASSAEREQLGQRVDFADLTGTVFGIACRDYQATPGTRYDLPMTLFPVGLR